MKRIKRTLAALLTVVLTLALLGEAVFADNSEQPVWPEEGAIQLSKSAAAVEGKENTWEVTLGIQGKNYKTTSDVVLVIDNSNSMYDNSRMAKTKAAANAFVDTLLTEERIVCKFNIFRACNTAANTVTGGRFPITQQHDALILPGGFRGVQQGTGCMKAKLRKGAAIALVLSDRIDLTFQ